VPAVNGINGSSSSVLNDLWLTITSFYLLIGLAIVGMAINIIAKRFEKVRRVHHPLPFPHSFPYNRLTLLMVIPPKKTRKVNKRKSRKR
jgi:hypothetical protein